MENINNPKDHNKPSEADVQMRKLEIREREKRDIKNKLRENRHRIICVILSIMTIICLFKFGFFKTLFIWMILAIGYGIGAYYDRDKNFLILMRNFMNSLR